MSLGNVTASGSCPCFEPEQIYLKGNSSFSHRKHFAFMSEFVFVADSQSQIWLALSQAFVPSSEFSRREQQWALFFCL
jgi:hypothetical protein